MCFTDCLITSVSSLQSIRSAEQKYNKQITNFPEFENVFLYLIFGMRACMISTAFN